MGARILIIEDNLANLDLMRYLLSAYGHEPVSALTGEDGLEVAQQEHLSLIICDIQLPYIDGLEVARRIRRDPVTREIPLLAVTAYAMVGDREKLLAAGFDGYLSKPIDPESFVTQVERFIPESERGSNRQQSASGGQPASAEAPIPASRRATILAVDDLKTNLELLHSLLEPHGFELVTTTSVSEASEIASKSAPDLILSDVNMPPSSGRDLLIAVRADEALLSVPIIFLTSTKWRRHDHQELLDLGAYAILERPIEPKMLLDFIDATLKAHGK